jgi:TonB family protein
MCARLCVSAFGLAVVLGLLAPGQAVAQPTAAGTSQPLTPAAIVLFTETASVPGTQTLMTAALADADPYLRRIAARVARVTNSVAQRPALERGLATEPEDSIARDEMVGALEALRGARPVAEQPSPVTESPYSPEPSSAEPGTPRVRLLPWIVPGLGRDVLKAAGCKLPRDLPYIAAHVTYTPTGRIAQAALESQLLSNECKRAGRMLTMLTLAEPGPITPGAKEIVVMAFDSDWLDCLEGRVTPSKPRARKAVRVGQTGIVAPTKTRNVNPAYPETAQSARVQGVVILDALITPEGCVSELGVRRSVHPQLDFAALRAVMGWRYTPTILDGVPIPVIMTVTVNFSLQP